MKTTTQKITLHWPQPTTAWQRIGVVGKSAKVRKALGATLFVLTGILLTQRAQNLFPLTPLPGAMASTAIVSEQPDSTKPKREYWRPPTDGQLPAGDAGKQIRYGRELIAHTAKYLGPNGTVRHISNGMNCQNCHLEAGTKVLGNNYSAVFSTYPKYRERSGSVESVVKRITDCFERSLSGKGPDSNSREMKAIVAYMKWLGTGVPSGKRPEGAGLVKLPYLDRAADPELGKLVYSTKCQVCHGPKGEGIRAPGNTQYTYPPLWGPHSYNDGAGLYRLASFAGYVKNNMPYGATYERPQLTDAESWDVAAFVNSMPRPHKDQSSDWPDISTKPIDFPFGPYADAFREKQHKYGPYQPIAEARKSAGSSAK
jgi:thiosulfate dehydrogenase